jgi:hypothetical protein
MGGQRLDDDATVARVERLAREGGRTPNSLALECGIGHMVVRRILREAGISLAGGGEGREVSRGHVAAALAEREAGQPLVTESLTQRLERLVPGAYVRNDGPAFGDVWVVWRKSGRGVSKLATGHTEREAVEKAIALWGRR